MEEIIRLQRATVEEHIGQENAHNWPAVYDTFAWHESAIDVVPFHAQFGGLSGIKDFYQAVDAAFPDFKADVWGEYDLPGCSVREITVEGTHKGERCGVAGTGGVVGGTPGDGGVAGAGGTTDGTFPGRG